MSPNPAILTWPRAVGGGGGGSLTATYIGQAVTGPSTTYTWTGVPIGNASATRTVLVVFQARISTTVTTATTITATIGGNAATVDYYKHVIPSESGGVATGSAGYIRLAVPSGTTATIVVTVSAACLRAGISVYTFDGAAALVDADWAYVSGAATVTRDLDAAAGGVLLAGAIFTSAVTLTNPPTTDHSTLISAGYYHLAGSMATTDASETAEWSTNNASYAVLTAATYQPA